MIRTLAVATLLTLAACKGGAGSTESAPTSPLFADLGSDVPMYPGAEVVSKKTDQGINGKPQRVVVLRTKDDETKARTFYGQASMKTAAPGLKFNLGEGRPNNAFWYTDQKRAADVRITVGGAREGTEIELKANQL